MAAKVNWNGTELERFWRQVVLADNFCWEWQGHLKNGYGHFSVAATSGCSCHKIKAHRWSYEHYIGPIPEGLEPDHLCRNRKCVNPWHLEPVTHRENCLRGESPAAIAAKQTHCIHGHPFSEENTYLYHGMRYCKTCKTRRFKEFKQRQLVNSSL